MALPVVTLSLQPKQRILFNMLEDMEHGVLGFGGDQPLDARISTPTGFIPMRDVEIGTQVSNPDGTISRVIQIRPQGEQDVYRISFSDGSVTETGPNHLWFAWETGKRYKRYHGATNRTTGLKLKGKIYTTQQIMERTERAKSRKEFNLDKDNGLVCGWMCIPVTEPVTYTLPQRNPDFHVHPYVMGVILGDGHIGTDGVTITSDDPPIIGRVEKCLGFSLRPVAKAGTTAKSYRIPSAVIMPRMKHYGLAGKRSWEKFIPKAFLTASVEERWELCRGLFDTDGTVNDGKAYYSTVSQQLASDVRLLVQGLGGTATITCGKSHYTKDGKRFEARDSYNLYVKFPNPSMAFYLERKKAKCQRPKSMYRRIVDIDHVGKKETQCIVIDNPNGLYLTDDFIVTHNSKGGAKSFAVRCLTLQHLLMYPGTRGLIFRRTYNELNENHIVRIFEDYPFMREWYNKLERMISIPNSSSLRFGYAETDDDTLTFQGKEYDIVVIDQAEQCSVYQISMLKAANRSTTKHNIRPKFVLTFNPGGLSHDWLRDKFVNKNLTDDERAEGWFFIQAHAWDNVEWSRKELVKDGFTSKDYYSWSDDKRKEFFLTRSDYAKKLKSLPDEKMREAYLWGDWNVFSGQFFSTFKRDVHVIPSNVRVTGEVKRAGSIDYGNVTGFLTGTRDLEGRVIVDGEVYSESMSPTKRAELIAQYLMQHKLYNLLIYGDTNMFQDLGNYTGYDKTPAFLFRTVFHQMMGDAAPVLVPISKKSEDARRYRVLCNEAIKEYLYYEADKQGNITLHPHLLILDCCKKLIETLPTLMIDERNPQDWDLGIGEDHMTDALKMLLMPLYRPVQPIAELTYEQNPALYIQEKILKPQQRRMLEEHRSPAQVRERFMQI
jgi:hypothetical protein